MKMQGSDLSTWPYFLQKAVYFLRRNDCLFLRGKVFRGQVSDIHGNSEKTLRKIIVRAEITAARSCAVDIRVRGACFNIGVFHHGRDVERGTPSFNAVARSQRMRVNKEVSADNAFLSAISITAPKRCRGGTSLRITDSSSSTASTHNSCLCSMNLKWKVPPSRPQTRYRLWQCDAKCCPPRAGESTSIPCG